MHGNIESQGLTDLTNLCLFTKIRYNRYSLFKISQAIEILKNRNRISIIVQGKEQEKRG